MVDNGVTRFGFNPDVNVSRTSQVIDNRHLTTMNAGDIVPIYCNPDILAGTTVSMDMSSLVRMSTPIFPVLDNCFLDLYWFFCPHRLVWDNYKKFFGESGDVDYEPVQEFEIPQICSSPGPNAEFSMWTKDTLADYFGLPTKKAFCFANALPFRAYCLIWNEWFRSPLIQKPLYFPKDDSLQYAFEQTDQDGNYDPIGSTHKGLRPAKANRFFDYFSGCLPSPQVGAPVNINLLGNAPVFASTETFDPLSKELPYTSIHFAGNDPALYNVGIKNGSLTKLTGSVTAGNDSTLSFVPDNLYADLSQTLVASVNELRLAFALQSLLERDARGVRYRELLYNHFGVSNGDTSMQVPEFLDGARIGINIDSIYNTTGTSERPMGSAAGFSLTTDTRSSFTKSFTEPGTLMCLAVIRTHHTYQQGLDRKWSKKRRFEHFYPSLANLGNQPVYTRELYFDKDVPEDDVFGYQEAWAEYRTMKSYCSGEFRSNYEQTLDSWHYADYYEAPPVLDSSWLLESSVNVDRTLAIQSSLQDQFICDFYFKPTYVQPVPLYSVPGLNVQHY